MKEEKACRITQKGSLASTYNRGDGVALTSTTFKSKTARLDAKASLRRFIKEAYLRTKSVTEVKCLKNRNDIFPFNVINASSESREIFGGGRGFFD